jgi:hypothetical protein
MRPHLHTDVISIFVGAAGVALVFHVGRWVGAYLTTKGASGPGNAIGGFFTFNGQ